MVLSDEDFRASLRGLSEAARFHIREIYDLLTAVKTEAEGDFNAVTLDKLLSQSLKERIKAWSALDAFNSLVRARMELRAKSEQRGSGHAS